MKARRSAEMLVAVRKGNWKRVEVLLREGAEVNTYGAHKVSPLMLVAAKGHPEVCNLLLSHHALPDARDEHQKRTALMYACTSLASNVADVAQALLIGGATVDLQDKDGRSGLMLAAEIGNISAALVLLEHGANVAMVAQDGSLNHQAMGMRGGVARRFLHNAAAQPTNAVYTYMQARRKEDQQFVEEEERACQEALDRLGAEEEPMLVEEALQYRTRLSQGQVIDDNIPWQSTGTEAGVIPIHSYESDSEYGDSEYDNWNFADTLPGGTFLSKVAPLRPKDLTKPQPEEETRKQINLQSEKLRGVVRRPAGTGDTALTIAARGGYADICDLLLHSGADSTALDRNGETALEVAAQGGHVEACRVLLTMRPSPEAHASALRAAEHTCSGAVIAQMLRGYEVHS